MATEAQKIQYAEVAAPSTPAAGKVVTYAKADGLMYSKDDAGVETLMSGGAGGLTDHDHTAGGDGGDLDSPVIDGYAVFNEESAPGTAGAATVRLYAKSDGLLYSKDDAGTETLVSGGSGGDPVPGWASALKVTTDSTHFGWDGNDVASFTAVTVTGSTTWGEGNNMLSVKASGMTSADANCLLIAQTINTSDAWVLPLYGFLGHVASGALWAGICMTDGTTSGSNIILGHFQIGLNAADVNTLLVGRHGTLTNVATAPWVLDGVITSGPMFVPHIRLTYVSSNTFRVEFGDGVTYSAFGEADISVTMTPTHVGIAVSSLDADDAILSFGPLTKV